MSNNAYIAHVNPTMIITIIAAYLLGSIPSSVWLSKYIFNKDIREYGSKNAGATNTFRVLGKIAGIIVLLADIGKGILAVSLSNFVALKLSYHAFITYQLVLGFAATLGHIYSVFLKFKGGKGVATFTGVAYYIFPFAALICTAIFLIVFLISHYISLSSMSSAVAFPICVIRVYQITDFHLTVLLALIPVLVIFTHRSNIGRIIRGEENKMRFFKKKKPS